MRIFLFIGILFLFFTSLTSAQDIKLKKKAQRVYLGKVKIIERLITRKTIKDEDFNSTVPFLEKLSGIRSYRVEFESCFSQNYSFIIPNKYNIEDWKLWCQLNKEFLFWNSTTRNICFVEFPKNLIKNPVTEYEKYLRIIDLDYSKYYEVSEDLFNYAYSFLESLTGHIVEYDHDLEFKFPTPKDILFYKNWIQEHKENLYWNEYTQKVGFKR